MPETANAACTGPACLVDQDNAEPPSEPASAAAPARISSKRRAV